jgi:S-formylglutathione hydrolase FrmB
MRVLTPSNPNPLRQHGFLWLLPVEPGQGTQYGDGIGTVQALDISNEYNLTCIQPGFPIDPWYGDNVSDSSTKQETFIMDLVVWAEANLATDGNEKHYLIGFSKSGFGGQVLFWRHQDVFHAVSSWDMAADYQTLSQYDGAAVFGTQANLDSYKLYDPNLSASKALGNTANVNRIWLGAGINLIQATSDYHNRLTADGIMHTYSFVSADSHGWSPTPGWVGPAVAAMLGAQSSSAPKPMPIMALFP